MIRLTKKVIQSPDDIVKVDFFQINWAFNRREFILKGIKVFPRIQCITLYHIPPSIFITEAFTYSDLIRKSIALAIFEVSPKVLDGI